MVKIAFVCLGNICRSPMAELIFKSMIERDKHLKSELDVSSFGTSAEEEGNAIYPPAARTLKNHGISGTHIAMQITADDVKALDYVLVMETRNRDRLLRTTGGKYADKIMRLCDYTDRPRDVADPWYTRDFETAYADIEDGCAAFYRYIKNKLGCEANG